MATSPASPPLPRRGGAGSEAQAASLRLSASGAATAIRVHAPRLSASAAAIRVYAPRLSASAAAIRLQASGCNIRARDFGVQLGIARCLHEDKDI